MSTDKESSAAGTDNRPPMLVESDCESWRIRIERYIRGKPLGKAAVQVTRDKRDEEFTKIENNKELADIQATNILSQGLPRHVFNHTKPNRPGKEIWDKVELLMQRTSPPTNNQLRTSSNSRSHATVHDGQIVPGNVGNTGEKESKRLSVLQGQDAVMEAKEKGTALDAEAEAFLADVECTAPYDLPLAITTTNMFEVSHEDAYDSDVDEGTHAVAAFMANLSSTSGTNCATTRHVNEVHTDANQIFDNVNHLLTHKMHQEEHLDSDVESDIDDNTILYHQYQLDSEVQDIPTEEQNLVNDSLRAELARCKQEMLEEENVLLKLELSLNVESINSLKNESKKVVSEKKVLKDKYLEEIVCLKTANKVAIEILQRFQQPTQTIPMLTKRPNLATHDLHKTALGSSNPWNLKQVKLSQPTLYDGHATIHSAVRVNDSEDALVYWLHAEEIASQNSNPSKPVTLFVHTRPAPSKVLAQLLKLKECFLAFEMIIKRRTTPIFHEQGEWRFVHTKKAFTEQVIPFYEHVKELVQSLDENLVKEVTEFMRIFDELNTDIAKDIYSIVHASDRDRPLRELLSSNCVRDNSKFIELEAEILNQQRMLAESDKRCSFDKQALETELTQLKDATTSIRIQNDGFKVENENVKRRYKESRDEFTGKITALTAENAKLKTALISKIGSGSIACEKPKVLAPGMYAISPKYILPQRRVNRAVPTPLPENQQVTFKKPPSPSNRPTQKTVVQQNKKPNVPVNLSAGVKPATGASKPMSKSDTWNHSTL
ncbi:hypothetical protein Tco_0961625, partial [Tanacetum coccineum]